MEDRLNSEKTPEKPTRDLIVGGRSIECNEVKYLEIHIDRNLSWEKHIEEIGRKARINQFKAIVGRRSELQLKTKERIYEASVRAIVTYGASIWGQAVDDHINKLKRI